VQNNGLLQGRSRGMMNARFSVGRDAGVPMLVDFLIEFLDCCCHHLIIAAIAIPICSAKISANEFCAGRFTHQHGEYAYSTANLWSLAAPSGLGATPGKVY